MDGPSLPFFSAAISIYSAHKKLKVLNNLRTANAYNCYTKSLTHVDETKVKPNPGAEKLCKRGRAAVRRCYRTKPFKDGGCLRQIRLAITLPLAFDEG